MNVNAKRILFVLPSLRRGGAEVQLVDLVNSLNPVKFEKYLFTFEKALDQLDRLNREDVTFYNQIRRGKFDISVARSISEIIDEKKIDVVHCSLQIALMMGWLGVRFARRNPRIVLALHTTVNRDRKHELFDRFFYQWLMRGCDKVICVCKAQEAHWQRKFPFLRGKTQVIYNGIDTDYFNPDQFIEQRSAMRQLLSLPVGATVACCIAGFRPEKGHALLIDAFECVLAKRPDVFLVLAGDGPLRAGIEQAVQDRNMADNVRFLGNVSDVRPLLSASEIALIPSSAETFSMAMLESLSMEIPLVAMDVGGTAEAVLSGITGLVVSGGGDAFASAIINMLEDDGKRLQMGKAGRKLVQDLFRKTIMVSDTDKVLMSQAERFR